MIPVWDAAVRILHWTLVLSVATAWLTRHSPGGWHEWLGDKVREMNAIHQSPSSTT